MRTGALLVCVVVIGVLAGQVWAMKQRIHRLELMVVSDSLMEQMVSDVIVLKQKSRSLCYRVAMGVGLNPEAECDIR
jgi:hypothetical protein